MSLKRIVINASCVMLAALTVLSMLIIHDQTNMYKELQKDYMVLSNEYDSLAEESKNKTIAIETLKDTLTQMENEKSK
jgi:hypothetical protein